VDPAALLPLVFSQPADALTGARAVLAAEPSAHDASLAYQAIGLVERDFGDLGAALLHLRRAVRLGRRSGGADREADAMAALGVALVGAGRTAQGLDTLVTATELADGLTRARVRFRLAGALRLVGRHDEAMAQLRRGLPVLHRAGDTIWVARAMTLRALIFLAHGRADRADRDFLAAEVLLATTDQVHDAVVVTHNRGLVAFRGGDLPAALERFDEAQRRYRELGTFMPELSADRCALLLAAGLPGEALAEADGAIARLHQQRGRAIRRAELLLIAAHAALAAGEVESARERCAAAGRLFTAQRREWWATHCRLLRLQIHFQAGGASGRLVRDAALVADHLTRLGSAEAAQAYLLAGRIARALGRTGDADRHLAAAARTRRRGPALARAGGWLAAALRADAAGRTRETLTACARGLDSLDEHRTTLGAPELRALATAHGAELAALAQRTSLRSGRPRDLFTWAERWRATALAVPPVRPPHDPTLQAALTRLREIASRLDAAHGPAAPDLVRARERVEREIRDRTRHLRLHPGELASRPARRGARGPLDVAALLDGLGEARLVEIVAVDGALHVLLCGQGQVRRFVGGTVDEAAEEVRHARAALGRLAYPTASAPAAAALARLEVSGARLEQLLLGSTVARLCDAPVVVVPPASLHGVPWPLLPALRGRAFNVAPSAAAWLRARLAHRPGRGEVVLVRGPGLRTDGAEVSAIAARYDAVTVLQRGQATAARVLDALDGSALAHIAAHGTFRADSPLFSSLRLDDGPLIVHDFDRLGRAPHRLILPSCDSGQLAPTGADELLGLATALLPLGTAGIVASVVPVNDEATVALMLGLHEGVRCGMSLAEALRHARGRTADDPVSVATGLSFVAVGAG
jgi:tetratricopeptide (TPR) repeat protein